MSRHDGGTRPGRRASTTLVVVACAVVLAACSSGSTPKKTSSSSTTPPATVTTNLASTGPIGKVVGGVTGKPGYLVYWDQNEEEDFLSMPSGTQGQLVPPWDPNGQMCILPDGRFVVGYDPTLPAQDNLGSAKPYKQPADGEELDEPNGVVQRPDPVRARARTRCPARASAATRRRRANGVFNNNQTYTGCAIDKAGNVFGNDIATAQGSVPTAQQRTAGGVVRSQLHDLLHRLRPDLGRGRAAPHRWVGRAGPARDDGPGRQRRPARPQRRHLERAPLRQRRRCPPARRSARAGSTRAARCRCRRSSRACRSRPGSPRTRRATASPSAATSATRASVG